MTVVSSRFAILLGTSFEESENCNIHQRRDQNMLSIYDGVVFSKAVHNFYPLTILTKNFVIDISKVSKYT